MRLSIFLIAVLASAATGHADNIQLANGDNFSGKLLSIKSGLVVWGSNYSAILTFPWRDVCRIKAEEMQRVVTLTGDQVSGTVRLDGDVLQVDSPSMGVLTIAKDKVGSVLPAEKTEGIPAPAAPVETGQGQRTPSEPTVGTKQKDAEDADAIQYALRRSGYLLRKGQNSSTVGSSYRHNKLNQQFATESREVGLAIDSRYGVMDRLEASVNIGVARASASGYSIDSVAQTVTKVNNSKFGLRDIDIGLKTMLCPERMGCPEILAFTQLTIPTGRAPDPALPLVLTTSGGHYKALAGITFLKASDPLVLYANVFWQTTLGGAQPTDWEIGDVFAVSAGIVFAVNHEAALGAEVTGQSQNAWRRQVDGAELAKAEPMSMRLWLTYKIGHLTYLEPYVRYGINGGASSTEIGSSLTFRF